MDKTSVKFKRWNCRIEKLTYSTTGRTALHLIDIVDGSPVATATVNIPEVELANDEVIIKDYSENQGMLDVLLENNIVGQPIRWVSSGFVKLPVCQLLI